MQLRVFALILCGVVLVAVPALADGDKSGSPASLACLDGTTASAVGCGAAGLWLPDLKQIENQINLAILVKF